MADRYGMCLREGADKMTETLPDVIARIKKSIVEIKLEDGAGSGVIVDPAGVIVTNRHVVGNRRTVTIKDSGGNEFEGKVVRSDGNIDYAIIKADLPDADAATFSKDPVREGMTVVAIGHPLGLDFTVTKGIISSANRTMHNVDYIQTDVAINPGNSGGPLIDEQGEVVGINSWTRTDAQNVGFAIPVSYIEEALAEVLPKLDKLDEMYYCNVCGWLSEKQEKYCEHCGVRTEKPEEKPTEAETTEEPATAESDEKTVPAADGSRVCDVCGAVNVGYAKFCKKCGKKFG
jgi:serine protease Do